MVFSGQDETINCSDCKQNFVFTIGEQAFFQRNEFQAPRRCKPCKEARKQNQGQTQGGGYSSGSNYNPAPAAAPAQPAARPVVEYHAPQRKVEPVRDDGSNDRREKRERKNGRRRNHDDDYGDY